MVTDSQLTTSFNQHSFTAGLTMLSIAVRSMHYNKTFVVVK